MLPGNGAVLSEMVIIDQNFPFFRLRTQHMHYNLTDIVISLLTTSFMRYLLIWIAIWRRWVALWRLQSTLTSAQNRTDVEKCQSEYRSLRQNSRIVRSWRNYSWKSSLKIEARSDTQLFHQSCLNYYQISSTKIACLSVCCGSNSFSLVVMLEAL